MLRKENFPILEFDDASEPIIKPSNFKLFDFDSDKLIITFFPDVIERLLQEGKIKEHYFIKGENPIKIYQFSDGSNTLIVHGYVGCPACAANLDLFNAYGSKKVMFCGGGGVLDKNIEVGQLLLVDGAIRDEGFSYHYLPAGRIVDANKVVNDKVAKYLDKHKINYLRGLVWTTDAIFRETKDKIATRKQEGAKIVEMEQAGCLAVAKVRGFDYAAIIYGGDDCAGETWDKRGWSSRNGIRYDLVLLCKSILEEM